MVNIIITDERSACLAGFGLTSVVTLSSESGGRTAGTPRWQAPELLDSQFVDLAGQGGNSLASDVHSCACVCYEACLVQYRRSCHTIRSLHRFIPGKVPFYEITNDCRVILARRPTRPPSHSRQIGNAVRDPIGSCWIQQPQRRPTASDIVGIVARRVQSGTDL